MELVDTDLSPISPVPGKAGGGREWPGERRRHGVRVRARGAEEDERMRGGLEELGRVGSGLTRARLTTRATWAKSI